MRRENIRKAEDMIQELEGILSSGIKPETGEELTDQERGAVEMRISNIWYDIEEGE